MDGCHKFKTYQLLESHFTYTMTSEHKNQQHQSLVTAVKCPNSMSANEFFIIRSVANKWWGD